MSNREDTTGHENAIRAYAVLNQGDLDSARSWLSESNPSDPLAMYVQARLTPDAISAVYMYKQIIAQDPGQPIVAEALQQLYEYHFASGDYVAAREDSLELQSYLAHGGATNGSGSSDSIQVGQKLPISASSTPASNAPSVSQPGSFVVQVGAFSTIKNAHDFISSLRLKGFKAAVFKKLADGRMLYAVSAGSFDSREAAESFADKLRSHSIDCIVVAK